MTKALRQLPHHLSSHIQSCCVAKATVYHKCILILTTRHYFRTAVERRAFRKEWCSPTETSSQTSFRPRNESSPNFRTQSVASTHSCTADIQATVCMRRKNGHCCFYRCTTVLPWLSSLRHSTAETCLCRCRATNSPSSSLLSRNTKYITSLSDIFVMLPSFHHLLTFEDHVRAISSTRPRTAVEDTECDVTTAGTAAKYFVRSCAHRCWAWEGVGCEIPDHQEAAG